MPAWRNFVRKKQSGKQIHPEWPPLPEDEFGNPAWPENGHPIHVGDTVELVYNRSMTANVGERFIVNQISESDIWIGTQEGGWFASRFRIVSRP